MRPHRLSHTDFQGHGVYEHDYLGMGAFGQLPDLSALQAYQTEDGLAFVDPAARPAVRQALHMMVFRAETAPELGGVSGEASFVLGEPGGPWLDDLMMEGYVVMVERASIPTGTLNVVATDQAASIVMLAKSPPAYWVIVDGHSTPLNQARALATGQQPAPGTPTPAQPGGGSVPSGSACPPGTINVAGTCFPTPPCPPDHDEFLGMCVPRLGSGTPAPRPTPGGTQPPAPGAHPPPCEPNETQKGDWCFPPPGGVEPEPKPPSPAPPSQAKSKLPKWAVPVALGAGVLGVGALIWAGTRQRGMRRNYKAWG